MDSSWIKLKPSWLAIAFIAFFISCDGFKFGRCSLEVAAACYAFRYIALLYELQLACWELFDMDQKATNLLAAMKSPGTPWDFGLHELHQLKGDIKHRQVPESAISPLFNLLGFAISSLHYVEVGLSILSHLTRRLVLQEQQGLLFTQGLRILPSIVNSLGDQQDRIRQRATQTLSDFWHLSSIDIEQLIRDTALTSESPRVKEASMRWIVKTNKEHDMQFKTFVPGIIDCLEDANGSVRDSAKATVVGLFSSITNDRAKLDLQKRLQQRGVNQSTVTYLLIQLGVSIPADLEPTITTNLKAASATKPQATPQTTSQPAPRPRPQVGSSTTSRTASNTKAPAVSTKNPQAASAIHSQEIGPSTNTDTFRKSVVSDGPPSVATTSVAEREAEQLEPAYVETTRDLEEIFRDMQPHFEGKESGQNWSPREKSIIRLRKITKGNGPVDFTATYLAGIKGLLDGILKTINSLRTTVSVNGCHLIQDVARIAGSGLDNMVEILLQNLIKLCANTKKIAASIGNATVDTILTNVSYNIRLIQHIWNACQDKNVQPRTFATGWLKTIISKHGQRKSVLEHGGGLDLMEKCIKAGLVDREFKVRESMRSTYWAFACICPEKSEHIITSLVKTQQDLLIQDPSNPNPQKAVVSDISTTGGQAPVLSRSTTSIPAARPSIRETIAAQKKRSKMAGNHLPDRPGSADSAMSSPKTQPSAVIARPATAIGSLSSAPVRPFRMAKKPDWTKQPKTVRAAVDTPAVEPAAVELPTVEPPAVELPIVEAPAVEVPTVEVPAKEVPAVETPATEIPGGEVRPPDTLKVYEDPLPEAQRPDSPRRFQASKVLEELPANKKFSSLNLEGKPVTTPGKTCNVVSARRLLESGIVRVRARTLDIHGFRKLQGLIRNQDDIWGDGTKYDELLLPLLESLEEPNDESKPAKALDLKTQVLVTVQLMLKHQPKLFATYQSRALCALLTTRKQIQSTSHLVYDLGEVSKLIINRCEPEDCIDAVLDLLETESSEIQESSTLFMGMAVLERLLHRYAIPGKRNHLTSEQEIRMGNLAARCLAASSPDVRRAVIRYVLELNDCIRDEPHFWNLMGSAREDHRDLITYYIARRAEATVRY